MHIRRGRVLDASAVLYVGRHHSRHRRTPAGAGLCDSPPLYPLQETDTDYCQQQVFHILWHNSYQVFQVRTRDHGIGESMLKIS